MGKVVVVVATGLYIIASGNSVAIRHLSGTWYSMKDSSMILVVNNDVEVPIFLVAHCGLVGEERPDENFLPSQAMGDKNACKFRNIKQQMYYGRIGNRCVAHSLYRLINPLPISKNWSNQNEFR